MAAPASHRKCPPNFFSNDKHGNSVCSKRVRSADGLMINDLDCKIKKNTLERTSCNEQNEKYYWT